MLVESHSPFMYDSPMPISLCMKTRSQNRQSWMMRSVRTPGTAPLKTMRSPLGVVNSISPTSMLFRARRKSCAHLWVVIGKSVLGTVMLLSIGDSVQ